MDNETKAMFVKLLEGQNRLETKVDNVQSEVDNIQSEVKYIKKEVNKNTIKLESIETKINTIAEVQTAHKEQNVRTSQNSNLEIIEKIDLIETSIKSVSKDVKETFLTLDVMKDELGRHQIDIEILKRRPV